MGDKKVERVVIALKPGRQTVWRAGLATPIGLEMIAGRLHLDLLSEPDAGYELPRDIVLAREGESVPTGCRHFASFREDGEWSGTLWHGFY